MTRIYAIRDDGFEFKALDLSTLDILRSVPDDIGVTAQDVLQFSHHNTSMASWWKTPETRFIANEGITQPKDPDISVFPSKAALVLSPRAKRLLGDTLAKYGEFLPVNDVESGGTYFIFNCLTCSPVDESSSSYEYTGDIPIALKSLVFPRGAESLVAFKAPYEGSATLFGNQLLKDAVDEFDLTGIVFDEELVCSD